MRIAMLSWESLHSIAVGGVAAHVSELAAALRMEGHDVHVFTRRAPGQPTHDCVDGVHYHRCQYTFRRDFLDDVNNMCRAFVDRFFDVEDFVGHFDIVHAHDWLAANAMIWIKQGRGHRCVLTIHSTEYARCGNAFLQGPSDRIRAQERAGTYWADRVIAVSNATKAEIRWMYELPEWKVSSVYNGVSPHRFDLEIDPGGAKREYAIGPVDPTVLFCGRLALQKGPDLLVEAAPSILRYYANARFVMAGEGIMRGCLESRVRQLGIGHAFRFLGTRGGEEIVRLFKLADVVCVPSRNEPFGIVVLEAWSARKPVVVTQNGGPSEFVQHEFNGLKIYPQVDSIAWGLGTMFMDFDRARWMGENGRRAVEDRFTWDRIRLQTLDVYALANPLVTASASQASDVVFPLPASVSEDGAVEMPSDEPAVVAASIPYSELVAAPAKKTAAEGEPPLHIYVTAKLYWRPRGAGDSVLDALSACKRVLAESGVKVSFHGRAARVEGRWDQVVDVVSRCFQLVDRAGQSQITATIMPPLPPLGLPQDLSREVQVPDRSQTEEMLRGGFSRRPEEGSGNGDWKNGDRFSCSSWVRPRESEPSS